MSWLLVRTSPGGLRRLRIIDGRHSARRKEIEVMHHCVVLASVTAGLLAVTASPALGQALFEEGCGIDLQILEGEVTGDLFGWVSNSAGDLDGDGVEDMIITAPGRDDNGLGSGSVYVYSTLQETLLFKVDGDATGWVLGHDAATAGDVNGDKVPDIIVGAPANAASLGHVRVVSGVDGATIATLTSEAVGNRFGERVHGGGDFNGDGVGDVIVGAPLHASRAGKAYVYSSGDWSLIASFDGTGTVEFGTGVAFVGDLNGDGRDEVMVGARHAGASGEGRAYVFTHDGTIATQLYELAPGGPAVDFGRWFMNGQHDVDMDGVPDLYVGDFAGNRADIFSGADGSLIHGLTGTGGFGIGRLTPDVDGDGHADAILASWQGAGSARIFSGIDGSIIETFTHNRAGANFGFDANGMGDTNGDGIYDYLVTAASDTASTGRAYVINGRVPEQPLPGDVIRDCVVNVVDLLKLLTDWGECPDPDDCRSDFNGDGVVDVQDLLVVLANFDV